MIENLTIGDALFIVLILGVIHGIMHLVVRLRKQNQASEENQDGP